MSEISSHLEPYSKQIEEIQTIGQVFWNRGWSVGTSSNYSVVVETEPLTLLVTASGKDKGRLRSNDFVLVDAHGEPIHEDQPKSSAETLLHCTAAMKENAGAVLHTHSIWSTILSERFLPQGGIRIEGFEMLKGLAGVTSHQHSEWLPIFENTQHIPTLAAKVEKVAEAEGIAHGYIIHKHGIYTWGQDLAEAFRHIEVLEFLLECIGRQAMLKM